MYKINNIDISEILESASNRLSSNAGLTGFNIGSEPPTYATYNELYHPFTVDSGISDYYVNKYIQNKGFIPKGYAPLTNKRGTAAYDFYLGGPSTIVIRNGKAYIYWLTLEPYTSKSTDNPISEVEVPKSFILLIQGAGGGGCGGSRNGSVMGGGCGPALILNVHAVDGLCIYISHAFGGAGGDAGNKGNDGDPTYVKYAYTPGGLPDTVEEYKLVAKINGGKGGHICNGDKDVSLSYLGVQTTNPQYCAFTTCELDSELDSTGYITKGGVKLIAISKAMQSYKAHTQGGVGPNYKYIPGCYYGTYNSDVKILGGYLYYDVSLQSNSSLNPIIASGTSDAYRKLPLAVTNESLFGEHGGGMSGYLNNDRSVYSGVNSILCKGGKYGESVNVIVIFGDRSGKPGEDGTCGSGGGAGGHGNGSIFGSDGKGGKGGGNAFAIYF